MHNSNTYTYRRLNRNNFKKPGARQCAPGLREQQQKGYPWHGLIQMLVQMNKPVVTPLACLYQTKITVRTNVIMSIHIYCFQEGEGTPSKIFVTQWYKEYTLSHTFPYKLVCSYFLRDVKLQPVKNVGTKPSRISPNHTC